MPRDLNAILLADADRRYKQKLAEDAALGITSGYDYHEARNLLGVPSNANRNVRYAEPWRGTAKRCIGWVEDEHGQPIEGAKYRTGTGKVVMRGARSSKSAQGTTTRLDQSDCAKMAPIGNVE